MGRERAAIEIIPRGQAEGLLAEIYQRAAGRSGEPANILAVSSLHPRALEDHLRLYRGLMFSPSPLTRVERELLATVVSRANECHY